MVLKDELGPEYLIEVREPRIALEGFLVIDNTVFGPGKGGLRMTENVNLDEIFRLARAMTIKNSLYSLPFGGAKSGILWKGGSQNLKKKLIESFFQKIKFLIPEKYIAGPDVNTGEIEMKWIAQTVGNWQAATGKPKNYCLAKIQCGIPHEVGSTGFGVAQATKVAVDFLKEKPQNLKVAIHGFGNVGSFTWKYLTKFGMKTIAIADKSGVIFSPEGLQEKEIEFLIKHKLPIAKFGGKCEKLKLEEFFKIPVDVLILASVTDVINEKNKDEVKAKIIVEGGNLPMKEEIEYEFFKKKVLVLPDIVVNAGGVLSSFAELKGLSIEKMFLLVKNKIEKMTNFLLQESKKRKLPLREIATKIAKERILQKMKKKLK